MEKFYITTPIYYPSDKLHVGHTYTTVAADTIARYKRMRGYDVMFLTGVDEHGQKIERAAANNNTTPQEYVDKITHSIKELWALMNISYDGFIRTTDREHVKQVQKIFKKLYDSGDIYKSRYEGRYCAPCESFWTERQAVDGKCPDCGRVVETASETGYFFRLSKYQDRILELLEQNTQFLQPTSRRNEMINNFLKPGLDDLCVSRTSFKWGVPVDFDKEHVVYVWIDALSNYITALGAFHQDKGFKKYWPADLHLMAKEIVRFHAIIWPALLMSLDIPLPKQVFGHGWLLLEGNKMSKSVGNVVDPVILSEMYGVDSLRYFLMREMPFGADSSFSNEALISRINSDLANDLGNLVSRTVSMVIKYFEGVIPEQLEAGEFDQELADVAIKAGERAQVALDQYQLSTALTEIWQICGRANKYIDETTPWILAKDDSKKARLAKVMYNLVEALRIISILISPFMPQTAPIIQKQLGIQDNNWDNAQRWGLLTPGFKVQKGEIIFPRIDH